MNHPEKKRVRQGRNSRVLGGRPGSQIIEKAGKKFIKRVAMARWVLLPVKAFGKIIQYGIECNGGVLVSYSDPRRKPMLDLVTRIKDEKEMLIYKNEGVQLFLAVRNTGKVSGEIAEVGVYRGGSAKIICEAKGDKNLHLFDTFAGLPEIGEVDQPYFSRGQFAANIGEVKEYLKAYRNVFFHPGVFPYNSDAVAHSQFSLVNLDVDTYESSLKCLEFFYPRMSRGGIILSHDYTNETAPGVAKAFDDFFEDKPEPIIEMSGTQCLVSKI